MKEKRENYVKPLSYVIESEQPLMSGGSIGISKEPENTGALWAFAAMRTMRKRKRTSGASKKEVLCKIGIVVQS